MDAESSSSKTTPSKRYFHVTVERVGDLDNAIFAMRKQPKGTVLKIYFPPSVNDIVRDRLKKRAIHNADIDKYLVEFTDDEDPKDAQDDESGSSCDEQPDYSSYKGIL